MKKVKEDEEDFGGEGRKWRMSNEGELISKKRTNNKKNNKRRTRKQEEREKQGKTRDGEGGQELG